MKYESQLSELIKLLPSAQSILILLPVNSTVDELAGGLALFLSLEEARKEAAIVTEGIIRVGHTNLFGVGEIQSKAPETHGGDFVITLEGVAVTDNEGKGSVPALEKLDYYTQGSNLNLVFKVLSGQKFEPLGISSHHEGKGFDLIFVIGAANFSELGSRYTSNQQLFTTAHVVNIDNWNNNSQFGTTNVVDTGASSVSEMISQILLSLNLPVNGDIATNILSGIFAATADLQKRNTGADTYEAVAQALRAGGQKPVRGGQVREQGGFQGQRPAQPQRQGQPQRPQQSRPSQPQQTQPVSGFDLSKVFDIPQAPQPEVQPEFQPESQPEPENFTAPPVTQAEPQSSVLPEEQASPEEAPAGEEVVTPEEDWLTPKIFKGKGNIG